MTSCPKEKGELARKGSLDNFIDGEAKALENTHDMDHHGSQHHFFLQFRHVFFAVYLTAVQVLCRRHTWTARAGQYSFGGAGETAGPHEANACEADALTTRGGWQWTTVVASETRLTR